MKTWAAVTMTLFLSWTLFASAMVQAWEAVSPKLNQPRGTESRRVNRFEAFLQSGQWDEGFEILQDILDSQSTSVVPVDSERYVSLQEYCHRLISHLPAEVLARYRGQADALAEAWYKRGIAKRDTLLLVRVLDQTFCSSWGDDALWALGELALERGEYSKARRCWQRLHGELAGEGGLAFPDSSYDLADVRARLLLVSIREGNGLRAERELEELRSLHLDVQGRLGGRNVTYAKQFDLLLKQEQSQSRVTLIKDWTTFAGSSQRTGVGAQPRSRYVESFSLPLVNGATTYPLIVADALVFQDGRGVHQIDLESGQQDFSVKHDALTAATHKGLGSVSNTLTATGNHVFGVQQRALGKRPDADSTNAGSVLWGMDRSRDGAFSVQVAASGKAVSFAGAPLIVGDRLLIAIRSNDRLARSGLACYDVLSGEKLWQNWLCQANTPATGWSHDLLTTLPTLDSGYVYLMTNLGAVACLRPEDGRINWISTYDRVAVPLNSKRVSSYYRGPTAAMVYQGTLYALPTDSRRLLALDAITGALLWSHPVQSDEASLIGVSSGKVALSDQGITILDLTNGEVLFENNDLLLRGQAMCVGETLFCPDGSEIHLIDIESGKALEYSVPLPVTGPANLAIASGHLVVVQAEQLTVYRADTDLASNIEVSIVP